MKHFRFTTVIAAGALVAGLGVAAMPAAGAATNDTTAPTTGTSTRDLAAGKARCEAAVDIRLAALDRLDGRIAAAKQLSDAHRVTLRQHDVDARVGLRALRTKIAGDTDPAALKADCTSVVMDYRIFALRAPQTNLVIADDAENAAASRLTAVEPKLADAIAKAKAAGKDVSVAEAALADLQAKLTDAASKATGVSDAVIVFTPAAYNADHSLLDPSRTTVKAAATDLKAARADIKTIVTAFRATKAAS